MRPIPLPIQTLRLSPTRNMHFGYANPNLHVTSKIHSMQNPGVSPTAQSKIDIHFSHHLFFRAFLTSSSPPFVHYPFAHTRIHHCHKSTAVLPDSSTSLRPVAPDLASRSSARTDDGDPVSFASWLPPPPTRAAAVATRRRSTWLGMSSWDGGSGRLVMGQVRCPSLSQR
jgi:hypothetical protein